MSARKLPGPAPAACLRSVACSQPGPVPQPVPDAGPAVGVAPAVGAGAAPRARKSRGRPAPQPPDQAPGRDALRRLLFVWTGRSPWLARRSRLMLAYLDFAFDADVSDSVRFRALERFTDMLERAGQGAEDQAPEAPERRERNCRAVQECLSARVPEIARPAARPLLDAFLDLAFARDVSESVRLRALDRILRILEQTHDDNEPGAGLPEDLERMLERFEAVLRGEPASGYDPPFE